MIKQIIIKNYAIIDSLEIKFQKGFTTITGETGAGKSIILGALNLLLGSRFESINFKDKSRKSIIEGEFILSNNEMKKKLSEYDLDFDKEIIIRREFIFQGKSRIFINDTPVKLDVLKKISLSLVDIHSQHENLLLTNNIFLINLLDQFCATSFTDFRSILSDYKTLFHHYIEIKSKIEDKKRYIHQDINLDYYKNIINEFNEISNDLSEKIKYENELKLISNLHQIKSTISESIYLLEESENSIISKLNSSISNLNTVKGYDTNLDALNARLKENSVDIQDVVLDLNNLNNNLSYDAQRFHFLENILNKINSLEIKLNVHSVDDLILKVKDIETKVFTAENASNDINCLKNEMNNLHEKLINCVNSLTFYRKKSSNYIIELLKNDLSDLGISYCHLKFIFDKSVDLLINGNDKISLMLSFNKGHDLKPLSSIVSGGEMARLMLLLKTYLFSVNKFSTIIFDEIDSGVSGDIGRKMGRILRKISNQGQVICITHSPQIASLGNHHYKISKNEHANSMESKIEKLNSESRINEIARMLSGDHLNNEAIANAKKMLDI